MSCSEEINELVGVLRGLAKGEHLDVSAAEDAADILSAIVKHGCFFCVQKYFTEVSDGKTLVEE